ncbi:Regulatory recX [Chlorella sorokiniana]|uniref:Regulatory protein RecX n=1 Tax=Chlorella sorokiniana TaxID=3076 RepID=A0A2P6TFY4_CHLSO|nr:Regulatory recX [Chlorella sorokiniana]|eukprot:PRW33031.1 Regulatory recX [Chlorella sorokiniana]
MARFPAAAAALALLTLLAAGARAVSPPPFTLSDIGTGAAEPANCSMSDGGGSMESEWLEITALLHLNASFQLNCRVPFPYTLSASDFKAPGWIGTCISRSPNAPADCEGDDCNVYIEEWLEFALLNCYGSYPTPGVNFFTNPEPAPGNVALAVTQTCKNYFYGPSEQWDFFYSVTDQWGNKWAMQTTHNNISTEQAFDELLAEVVWPAGWKVEKVPLTETQTQIPYMVGNGCYAMVLKDSEFNSWHLYDYPAGGFSKNNSLLGAMGNTCERLDAQYTLAGMGAALAQRWGAAEPAAAAAAGRSAACRALYHRHNPWNLKVEREDGEELPGVQNLEMSMDEMDEQKKKAEKGLEGAKQAALKMLSARAHSRKELKAKLLERGHELNDVRDALDRLEAVGLQSDAEFAETFARSKWRQSKWGARRIEMELQHRGVPAELASAALRSVFGEDGLDLAQHLEQLEDEQGERLPLAHAGPEQQLLDNARRQWGRMANLSEEARRRRFVAWMQRRGHVWGDIRGLLHTLEKEDSRRKLDGED